jgi:hypothetical protein
MGELGLQLGDEISLLRLLKEEIGLYMSSYEGGSVNRSQMPINRNLNMATWPVII